MEIKMKKLVRSRKLHKKREIEMVLKKEEKNETGLVGYTLAISERKVKYDLQNKESIS